MKDARPNPQGSSNTTSAAAENLRSLRNLLKSKRIAYLTLPLLIMATVTEFVILATGWKYQQVVCVPKGMGVTFLGIGPIGATILAVELLKLPLAIWTASRQGWTKVFMLFCGLPLICVLTFQLVKDMAVYEMGVAMTPASQMLEKATDEEVKISQLSQDLAAIEQKKADREHKLADITAKQAKAKADLDELLKRNDDVRKDAVSLTDYQKKELQDVDARESAIIQQFNADTDQLNKSLADLRARRETELARDSKWNAEQARIDNDYKVKLADYTNKKTAYDKAKSEYDNAGFLKRQVLKEPISPGVAPEKESNTLLKSTLVADLEAQIKAKESELVAVNNKRRDRIAQIEADAHQLRQDFDKRSSTKRDESDHKREDLIAAQTALAAEWKAEQKQIDAELAGSVQKVDGIRTELDAARKRAQGFYEAREASIRATQVHRIATTVEIVRGLIKGERPMSIKATAKERGDILTDQISMVRIWVYPVLAFIVAFLPTLMVEIGFSTVFKPETNRKPARYGVFGQGLHFIYKRAGRLQILRAERLAKEATGELAKRDRIISANKAAAEKALAEKEGELRSSKLTYDTTIFERDQALNRKDEEHTARLKSQEKEWVAKLAGMADSLNRTVVEKDALKDLQRSEVERQIQMRQNAWSDRVSQLQKELDEQRAAAETERTTLMQTHQKKLLEITEDCKTQVIQARRQASDAEMAAMESSGNLARDLKEAILARDDAESRLRQQADTFNLKLSQAREETAREVEKAARQEKHRSERHQLELTKNSRQREEAFEHQLKQREQELTLGYEARLVELQTRHEAESRRREAELERKFETRASDVEARWKQEAQQREEVAQLRIKQREQQLQVQSEARLAEIQTQTEQELRRVEAETQRQLEGQSRDANVRWKQELQQKELALEAKLKQREQELALRSGARETELQDQWATGLRLREEEWERQAEMRVRAAETRLTQEAQQKEDLAQSKARQRDQQWQVKLDAARAEAQTQAEELVRRRETEIEAAAREREAQLRKEMQEKEEALETRVKQREQELVAQAEARRIAAQSQWEADTEIRVRTAVDPLKTQLTRAEKERDEAREAFTESASRAQTLEKKLTEASTFLNGWRNGKDLVGAT